MSALTKLFVVLLVVCSLMLSASVVVFVNRVEDYHQGTIAAQDLLVSEKLGHKKINDQLMAAVAAAQQQTKTDQDRVDAERAKTAEVSKDLNAAQTEIAEGKKGLAIATADKTKLTEALAANAKQSEAQEKEVTGLRKTNDDLTTKIRDLNVGYTELASKNDALEKRSRYLEEQLSEVRAQLATVQPKADEFDRARGGGDKPFKGTPQPINGVVTDVVLIGGLPFAKISVGSAQGVSKGMEFKAINRQTGEFLGILTIEQVQPDEAIGQIRGPKVNAIAKNTEVRTQL